jgi:DNA-binding NtrC family response regulator
MDALDLLGKIKRRYPELPVMMVTAYGDHERRRRGKKIGRRRVSYQAGRL